MANCKSREGGVAANPMTQANKDCSRNGGG